jgi:hypothetical protein
MTSEVLHATFNSSAPIKKTGRKRELLNYLTTVPTKQRTTRSKALLQKLAVPF